MNRKGRLLLISEFSGMKSGYGTYTFNLQKRLAETGRYEIAELAAIADPNDPRAREVATSLPWKVYWNSPADPKETEAYRSDVYNVFGKYRLNETLLDFRPDIVWAIRDPYVDEFIGESPFRQLFHWVEMPTVDSRPQAEQFISMMMGCDAVLTYTDWGMEVLEEEGGGLIPIRGVAPSGADYNVFRPLDRAKCRDRLGFGTDDVFVVGYTSRNQFRKLYPQLIRDFSVFLEKAPEEMARKSYLYLHVSYPDKGWDIPWLIKQSGISHRILLTYKCRSCGDYWCGLYRDAITFCDRCGQKNAGLTNVKHGVTPEELATIYNAMDVYVQYSTNEGFGIGLLEAAACGVPVMAVDYSAMADLVRKLGGRPLKVKALELECDTGAFRALPDGSDLVDALLEHAGLDAYDRLARGLISSDLAREHFDWDKIASTWMEVFDGLPLREQSETWSSPPRLWTPRPLPEEFSDHAELVRWGITNILGRPELATSYMSLRMIRDLSWGVAVGRKGKYIYNEDSAASAALSSETFDPEKFVATLLAMNEEFNKWERIRCGLKA